MHSHGGQVRIFTGIKQAFQKLLPTRIQDKIARKAAARALVGPVKKWRQGAGMHRLPNAGAAAARWLYINVGLGSHLLLGSPFRINCKPEITVLTLTRANAIDATREDTSLLHG